jgi:hypothetical protein
VYCVQSIYTQTKHETSNKKFDCKAMQNGKKKIQRRMEEKIILVTRSERLDGSLSNIIKKEEMIKQMLIVMA